ncbi:MAG: tRNA (adenosine(37)-N6)-threonylcarbamoyltransferase complex dimerization subunit type 1 TsaB [Bacilli bacterium]|nr:tRNA (adenosine(37)-N6)-threonylcarbamoyltransferase complex dimerization subunit type 1 TsaB [Bacilli bacterium]
MKYLFLDTSSDNLSVAIIDNDIIKERTLSATNNYSKHALVELETIFNEAKIEPIDINKLFVINGPGSFTGVRIGVTIIKTFAWSLNKPVIPISSLKAYAISLSDYDYYVSVIDARRESVYVGIYDKDYNSVVKEAYMSINEVNELISNLNGKVAITGNIDINSNKTIPAKLDIMKIINYYKDNNNINAHELKPNYLKRVEAEEKLMGDNK